MKCAAFKLWTALLSHAAVGHNATLEQHNASQALLRHLRTAGVNTVSLGCKLSEYEAWKLKPYTGPLLTNTNFWPYLQQPVFVLTNELALALATAKCRNAIKILIRFRTGRVGPVPIQTVYKTMCQPYCLQSDVIHQSALTASGCTCGDLSTPPPSDDQVPGNSSYTIPNDWCQENSANMLCNIIGFCGIWNCRVTDFMCPRYEWDKKYIPLKGLGSCVRGLPKNAAAGGGLESGKGGLLLATLLPLFVSFLLLWIL